MNLPQEFADAAAEPVLMTVGELLGLFGERNRDFEIVGRIENILAAAGLTCEPPLTEGWTDDPVRVCPPNSGSAQDSSEYASAEEPLSAMSLRISDLPTARLPGLLTVNPDSSLEHAQTQMMLHNFSQLPVLSGPYSLRGTVSWESIAMAHARGSAVTLADATVEAQVVSINADLLTAIPDIYETGYVFVRAEDHSICGIVTAADLSVQFGELSGPYLRLGEIERRLRKCVDRMCCTVEDLRDASGNKKADTPDNLTVWQLQNVFAKPDRWAVLNWGVVQETFVSELDEIRKIRNEVAHFRPDPLNQEQRERLLAFAGWLKRLSP